MRLVVLGLVLAGLSVLAISSGCDTCPFRALDRIQARGTIGCCGAFARHDVVIPDGADRQIDLASTALVGASGVDLWLTSVDCVRLFDGQYPGASPLCRTIVGPVTLGSVSTRVPAAAGTYRVLVQAYSTNTT